MTNLTIDTQKTALVVIDLQKGIVANNTVPYSSSEVIANASAIAKKFRENTMPVFLVRVSTAKDGSDRLTPVADQKPFSSPQQPDWSEIVPEMGPSPDDIVITKHQWGAFYGTELDLQLRRRGITTIVLCGISTSIGVESTARFAFEYGYNQIFVEDAMAAMSADEHQATVSTILPRIGLVRTTQDVLSSL